jgi:alpha-D-ribose 1-methylphosphonate 5-triphosphate synthase subunit PhnH
MTVETPALSARAAREQRVFRALLERMARPGTIGQVAPHEQGGAFAPAVALLEAVLDHEVSFAVLPDSAEAREPLLRYTGSRVFKPERADFLLCRAGGIVDALARAKHGELEYPDRSALVVALIAGVSAELDLPNQLDLSGPGINGAVALSVDGFGRDLQAAFARRNRGVPLGVDLVLVAPDGRFTCLTRYTRIAGQEG